MGDERGEDCNDGTRPSSARSAAHAIFFALSGSWTFSRTCRSATFREQNAEVTGRASFVSQGAHATEMPVHHYTESGVVRLAAFVGRCSRALTYVLDEANGAIEVRLRKDGTSHGLLHRLQLSRADAPLAEGGRRGLFEAGGIHSCGEDRYRVHYRFCFLGSVLDRFLVHYRLTGPRKDYEIKTGFARLNSVEVCINEGRFVIRA